MRDQKSTLDLNGLRSLLTPFCRKYAIRKLEVFGSTARGGVTAQSDVDLLATFEADRRPQTADLLEMAGEAEEIVGRPVDFVLRDSLERSANPYTRKNILDHAVCIYGE